MLSIIIPTLNEERFLPLLLDDLKRQSFKDFEITVSDGGSKDRTRIMARKEGCRVVECLKSSPAHQRNQGAAVARGNSLLFMDADSRLYTTIFLEKSLEEFESRKLRVATGHSPQVPFQLQLWEI